MEKDKLVRVLVSVGKGSRRVVEELIREGNIRVNGKMITEPGFLVIPGKDHIKVNGKLITKYPGKEYVLINKPAGMVSSVESKDTRRTLLQLLAPLKVPVRPIEGLDVKSEGLILCTNDSELVKICSDPDFGIPKTYLVKVRGLPTESTLEKLRKGVALPDGRTYPIKVRIVSNTGQNTWLQMVIYESRAHLIERMLYKVHHPVRKIKRTAYAGLTGQNVPLGAFRWLSPDEKKMLKALMKNPPGLPERMERSESAEHDS